MVKPFSPLQSPELPGAPSGLPCSFFNLLSSPLSNPAWLFFSNNTARRGLKATSLSLFTRGPKACNTPSIARSCHCFKIPHVTPISRHTSPGFLLSVQMDNTALHFSSAVCPNPLRPLFSSTPNFSAFSFSIFSISLLLFFLFAGSPHRPSPAPSHPLHHPPSTAASPSPP